MSAKETKVASCKTQDIEQTEGRMEKFTPGPWRYWRHVNKAFPAASQTAVFGSGEKKYIMIAQTHIDGAARPEQTVEELIANARLISAAPEMYEALADAVEKYGKPGGPWNVPGEPGSWIEKAKAALQKARGEKC